MEHCGGATGMQLLIFGATGGTGRALVQQALEQGHIVTVFARDPAKVRTTHKNLVVVKGDVSNYGSVEAAVNGQDAVLSALGVKVRIAGIVAIAILCQVLAAFVPLPKPLVWVVRAGIPVLAMLIFSGRKTTLSDGTRNIVLAMQKHGVKRLVYESSLGIGDSKGRLGLLYNIFLIPLLLRGIFADKEVQEKIIKDSALEWVIVRPAALTNGSRKGTYKDGMSIGHGFLTAKIARADVADFMLKQLTDHGYLRQTPGVSY
jgi:putative NADH-flavin reductase